MNTYSVIMTVRNGERFIFQALRSVEYQTIRPSEIIIVDDGSTDTTVAVVKDLVRTSACAIKLIETEGIGRAAALNLAWREARCDWIANLDVDDSWHAEKMRLQLGAIEEYKVSGMVITDTIRVENDHAVRWPSVESLAVERLSKQEFFSRNPINHSSVLLKRTLLEEVDGYNENLTKQIDYDLWLRIVSAGYDVYRIPLALSVKRLHSAQSFEASQRLSYLAHDLLMNYRSLRLLKAPCWWYLLPPLLYVAGLLPRNLRSALRRHYLAFISKVKSVLVPQS